jgi:uncharacterized protein
VKVDREERPDVDRVYMTFVQRTTGSGGWPMSVWLTPELKPFYGGTYFPPTSMWGKPAFADILREIARVWKVERENVRRSADGITAQLQAAEQTAVSTSLTAASALASTVAQFRSAFDAKNGGFGDAPKFPRPSELFFLLREHARTGDEHAREMVVRTLKAMALGGMRDHIGGGFHRYSVDGSWRVPHFEKMLYDQAQLVLAFLEAAQASGDPFHIEVAEDTLRYVMREMTDKEGGFFSAEDADSIPMEDVDAGRADAHKSEGAFYLWRAGEVDALLGEDAEVVKRRFGILEDGNAPFDPQQEFTGKNLLYAARSIDDLASEQGTTSDEIAGTVSRARLRMFRARLDRPRPQLDDKVLTAWNGLMIAAFARAARVIQGEPFLQAARRAAGFIRDRMWNSEPQTLLRRFRDGHAEIEGYAEDYAFLIFGLLELFQADPDPQWLNWAVTLQRRQDALFWDDENGGWFSTTGADPTVLLRMKDDYDGAEPGGSSMSVMNLLTLSHLVEDAGWTKKIEQTLRLFGSRLEQMGRAVPMMAAALSTYWAGPQQIVIAGAGRAGGARAPGGAGGDVDGAGALATAVATRYLPFAVSLRLTPEQQGALVSSLPMVAGMKPVNGAAAAYVCRNFACRAPVTSAEELEKELRA